MGHSSSKQAANVRKDGDGQPMRQYDVTLGDSLNIQPKVALKMSMGRAAADKSIRFVQPTAAASDPAVIEKLEMEAPEAQQEAPPSAGGEGGTANQVTGKDGTVYVWVKKSATEVEFLDSGSRKVLALFDLKGGPADGVGRLYVAERLVGTDFFDLVGTLMATWMANASTAEGGAQSSAAAGTSSAPASEAEATADIGSGQAAPPPVPTVRIVQSN